MATLQQFLIDDSDETLTVTSCFGPLACAAVIDFQTFAIASLTSPNRDWPIAEREHFVPVTPPRQLKRIRLLLVVGHGKARIG